MSDLKINEPTANVLINSMRSMGYSFESALADIIDNSISAGATEINIRFPVNPGNCFVAVIDNGTGMTDPELFDAMKYGSEIKSEVRDKNDLGRFGLGLKAASLSQCRRLTVLSKKDNIVNGYVWDLDTIDKEKKWVVIKYADKDIKANSFYESIDNMPSGTVVLWEKFDIIEKESGDVYSQLNKYMSLCSEYLSLIFHRYLNRSDDMSVVIKINSYSLKGLDPFLEEHKKTNIRRQVTICVPDSLGCDREISVQPYVLPFQKDLSKEDYIKIGGVEKYRTSQGFYIYRNMRLIIWGTWFGRQKNELTKHARVKVDIPNSLDDIWAIDIKKQHAKIPAIIKNQLTRAVDEAMDIAVKAQKYRGRIAKIDDNTDYIWERIETRNNNFTYRINKDSRIFDIIKDKTDDTTWNLMEMVLEEIEQSVPYQQIYIDKSSNSVDDKIDENRKEDIKSKAVMLIKMALQVGNSTYEEIIERLFLSEPFMKYPTLKDELTEMEIV